MKLPLHIVTIALDAMPFITRHLPVFEKLSMPWTWSIREGAAANTHDTRWCARQKPRLSKDGTTEYLQSISKHPNVRYYSQTWWDGKTSMFNDVVAGITEPCILMQVDADEIWQTSQLDRIVELFESQRNVTRAYFLCRYFVGPDIITTGINCYGNQGTEWLRAWRFTPSQKFITHEPPNLAGNCGNAFHRLFTAQEKLIFDHFSWSTKEQVAFKERFYNYPNALDQWKRLQANTHWPVSRLKDWLPWVDDRVGADKIKI